MSSGFLRYRNLGESVTYVNGSAARIVTCRGVPRADLAREAARDPAHRARNLQAASRSPRWNLAPAALAGHDRQVGADELAAGTAGRRAIRRSVGAVVQLVHAPSRAPMHCRPACGQTVGSGGASMAAPLDRGVPERPVAPHGDASYAPDGRRGPSPQARAAERARGSRGGSRATRCPSTTRRFAGACWPASL